MLSAYTNFLLRKDAEKLSEIVGTKKKNVTFPSETLQIRRRYCDDGEMKVNFCCDSCEDKKYERHKDEINRNSINFPQQNKWKLFWQLCQDELNFSGLSLAGQISVPEVFLAEVRRRLWKKMWKTMMC